MVCHRRIRWENNPALTPAALSCFIPSLFYHAVWPCKKDPHRRENPTAPTWSLECCWRTPCTKNPTLPKWTFQRTQAICWHSRPREVAPFHHFRKLHVRVYAVVGWLSHQTRKETFSLWGDSILLYWWD